MNAYQRWVSLIVPVLDAERDPRTLAEWGRQVGASASTLRSRCAAAGQGAKASLDFARLLRLVVRLQAAGDNWDPAAELSSCDPRTAQTLLSRGGFRGVLPGSTPPSVTFFLDHQRFVSEGRALADLKQALVHRGVLVEPRERYGSADRGFSPSEDDPAPDV